jgi:hypothetical protein
MQPDSTEPVYVESTYVSLLRQLRGNHAPGPVEAPPVPAIGHPSVEPPGQTRSHQSLFNPSSIPIHYLFITYSLPICFFTAFSLPFHCLSTAYSLPIHCLFTTYSLSIHCLFTAYSLPIHCLFTAIHCHSLPVHCLFAAYSLPIHCLQNTQPHHRPIATWRPCSS